MNTIMAQSLLPDSLVHRLANDTITFVFPDTQITNISLDTINFYSRTLKLFYKGFFLKNNLQYRFLPEQKRLLFLQPFQKNDTVMILFKKLPFPEIKIQPEDFFIEIPDSTQDSLSQIPTYSIIQRFEKAISEDVSDLKKSGSFVRGFQLGSNQNLTLNSSLNLFLKGNITKNTSITAALTDENTPIQPEGNTQTLNEVDKVYIQITSPYIKGVMGDFDFRLQESPMDRLNRKLQGIWVESDNPAGIMSGIYASKRGNYHRNAFLGQEGNQGPYILTGENGERNIIILAGSERVYINGQLRKRGENLDYVIDYTTGELTFSSNYLVSSESRIEVDFEYLDADQRFTKNLYMLRYKKNITRRLKFKSSFYEEKDDINRFLADSGPLTDEEKNILRTAGNNPDSAVTSGVARVDPGDGYYVLRDTIINGDVFSYYKYDRENGEYVVRFSITESGAGSYVRKKLGEYEFVGPGRGNFNPVVRIPLPSRHRLYVVGLQAGDSSKTNISGEMGISDLDRNYLSPIGDKFNQGTSGRFNWNVIKDLKIKQTPLKSRLSGYWSYADDKFSALDRYRQADFNRYWNISADDSQRENRWESNLMVNLPGRFNYNLGLGEIRYANDNISKRLSHGLGTNFKQLFSETNLEYIKRESESNQFYWQRHRGSLGFKANPRKIVKMFVNYERKEDLIIQKPGGFKNYQAGLNNLWQWTQRFTSEFLFSGKDEFLFVPDNNGQELKQARIIQLMNKFSYSGNKNFDTEMIFNFRRKDFTREFENYSGDKQAQFLIDPQFQDTTWQDRKSYSMNLRTQWRLFSRQFINRWEYTVASELTAIQEKVYLKVSGQLGNYRYDETLDEYVQDTNGDYILIIVPSGSYMPTSNVLFNWQTEWRPSRKKKKINHKFKSFLNQVQMTNRIKIEEKTNHKNLWDIYFLNVSTFQKSGETLRGNFLWSNNLNLFNRHPVWNVRVNTRYQKQFLNIYLEASDNDQRKIWDEKIAVRYRASSHFKQELEGNYKINQRLSPASTDRNRNISSLGVGTRSIFKIWKGSDNTLEFFAYQEEDRRNAGSLKAHYFKFKEKLTATVFKKGRLTSSLQWYKIIVDSNPLNIPLPYEMAEGKKAGDSWEWSTRMDYFVSNYLTFTLNYQGRKDPIFIKTIHTGLMELRAFF